MYRGIVLPTLREQKTQILLPVTRLIRWDEKALGRRPRPLELLRVFFRLLGKLANVSASPTPELTLSEPYHFTEYGQLYVTHCVPKHWQTRPRLQFRSVKTAEALTIK